MNTELHRLAALLHDFTNKSENGFNFLLDKIQAERESGYSSETMLAIDMANDAKNLRAIADRIEGERRKLISQVHLVAAE